MNHHDHCNHTQQQYDHDKHETHQNHDKHEGHSPEMFREKFWLSLILTIPTLLYSTMIQDWLGFTLPVFSGSRYIPLFFGTILFFYAGLVFIKGAFAEIRSRQPGMMSLISLAIVVSYIYSIATTFFLQGSEFFWELSTLITIMIFGHWMEMKSVMNAQGALKELAKLLPDTAELVDGKIVPTSELKVGDMLLIRPGAKIPADAIVLSGESSLNESMITGESNPVHKTINSEVIAGTVNGSGSLKVQVSKVGSQTALAGIMRLIEEAQNSRSKAQILADQAAFYLTIIAIVSGIGTLVAWVFLGQDFSFALERTVTVLIIACPHALGLAIPLVTSISTSLAARNGLLVRQRIALESARNINVVLFDKTGTLTKGEHGVVDLWPTSGYSVEQLLALSAAAESESEHAIAKAIVDYAKQKKFQISKAESFRALPGKGVQAIVEGQTVLVASPMLILEKNLKLSADLQSKTEQAGKEGKTVVYVILNDSVIGAITTADLIREESRQAVKSLTSMGMRVAMLTGDSEAVASYVAKELGIKEYFAQVLPEHKVDKVKELQKDGSRVAMVGDGVNDAPALTQADIGIAIGAGTDVAIESAGIILAKNDPRDVVKVIQLSKATYTKMKQNLVWATGYNVLAIPLAAGIFGVILPAAIGALLMSASTVIVALNAQWLRRLKLNA